MDGSIVPTLNNNSSAILNNSSTPPTNSCSILSSSREQLDFSTLPPLWDGRGNFLGGDLEVSRGGELPPNDNFCRTPVLLGSNCYNNSGGTSSSPLSSMLSSNCGIMDGAGGFTSNMVDGRVCAYVPGGNGRIGGMNSTSTSGPLDFGGAGGIMQTGIGMGGGGMMVGSGNDNDDLRLFPPDCSSTWGRDGGCQSSSMMNQQQDMFRGGLVERDGGNAGALSEGFNMGGKQGKGGMKHNSSWSYHDASMNKGPGPVGAGAMMYGAGPRAGKPGMGNWSQNPSGEENRTGATKDSAWKGGKRFRGEGGSWKGEGGSGSSWSKAWKGEGGSWYEDQSSYAPFEGRSKAGKSSFWAAGPGQFGPFGKEKFENVRVMGKDTILPPAAPHSKGYFSKSDGAYKGGKMSTVSPPALPDLLRDGTSEEIGERHLSGERVDGLLVSSSAPPRQPRVVELSPAICGDDHLPAGDDHPSEEREQSAFRKGDLERRSSANEDPATVPERPPQISKSNSAPAEPETKSPIPAGEVSIGDAWEQLSKMSEEEAVAKMDEEKNASVCSSASSVQEEEPPAPPEEEEEEVLLYPEEQEETACSSAEEGVPPPTNEDTPPASALLVPLTRAALADTTNASTPTSAPPPPPCCPSPSVPERKITKKQYRGGDWWSGNWGTGSWWAGYSYERSSANKKGTTGPGQSGVSENSHRSTGKYSTTQQSTGADIKGSSSQHPQKGGSATSKGLGGSASKCFESKNGSKGTITCADVSTSGVSADKRASGKGAPACKGGGKNEHYNNPRHGAVSDSFYGQKKGNNKYGGGAQNGAQQQQPFKGAISSTTAAHQPSSHAHQQKGGKNGAGKMVSSSKSNAKNDQHTSECGPLPQENCSRRDDEVSVCPSSIPQLPPVPQELVEEYVYTKYLLKAVVSEQEEESTGKSETSFVTYAKHCTQVREFSNFSFVRNGDLFCLFLCCHRSSIFLCAIPWCWCRCSCT